MKTILLVEDSPNLCALYQEELDDIGYRTLCASNGSDALEQIGGNHLDLVILDIKMPMMDGLEVLERMSQAWPHLPVIINSGFDCPRNICTCSPAAYVRKSGDLTELLGQVQRVLGLQESDLLLLRGTDSKA